LGLALGLIFLTTRRFRTDEQDTILVKTKTVLETDGLLLDGASILAILADVETEGGISGESLSVHTCEHWALGVNVIVSLNGRFAIQGS
jgi:hypothetical protein